MIAKKRVAVVAFSAPPLSSGGVASAHFNLFQALKAAGLEARLFTFGDDDQDLGEEEIVRSGSPAWWVAWLRFLNRWIFKLLQPGKRAYQSFDILSALPGARAMARRIREWAPEVVVLSDHGAPGLAFRKGRAKLLLVSHHNPARFLEPPAPENYSKLDARFALHWEQKVLDRVDAVVCPSAYMQEFFQRSYHYAGPVERIPNLLNSDLLAAYSGVDLRETLGLTKAELLIYLPSAGSYLKGADFVEPLIAKLNRLLKGRVAFYLPGNIEKKYEKVFESLSEEGMVHLPGQVQYAENIGLARQCDFCISLSLMENYSMALLEAALLGLPILAFNTGGNADIVHEGENGFLFELGDTAPMAEQAQIWAQREALEEFQINALSYSLDVLDPSITQQAYVELIDSP